MIVVGYPSVIRREEAVLRGRFGAEFDSYAERTPVFFPALQPPEESDTYTVNPRLFRRTMVDVVWFVWLIGPIELVESLHEIQIVEPLIRLP